MLPNVVLYVLSREIAVAQKKQQMSTKPTLPNANPAELTQMGIEAMTDVQNEFIDAIEEVNREWAARIKAEQDLAIDFAGKLRAARSIPEMAAICQQWIGRRIELLAEDNQRLVANIQKFTMATARVLPKGWAGGSN
jgi:Phasin protein